LRYICWINLFANKHTNTISIMLNFFPQTSSSCSKEQENEKKNVYIYIYIYILLSLYLNISKFINFFFYNCWQNPMNLKLSLFPLVTNRQTVYLLCSISLIRVQTFNFRKNVHTLKKNKFLRKKTKHFSIENHTAHSLCLMSFKYEPLNLQSLNHLQLFFRFHFRVEKIFESKKI